MTEEIINLKDYFVHQYDDWGRLYCVEFKGSPLELENSIKRLEQENEELKKENKKWREGYIEQGINYRSALEEIRNLVRGHKIADEVRLKSILDKINEVLNDI